MVLRSRRRDGLVLRPNAQFRSVSAADRGHGARSDALGGGDVLRHQQRRDGENVADVIEAVAGIVGGEVFVGLEIDGQEIADGVAIFVAVEAVGDDAAGVGFDGLIEIVEAGLDVAGERGNFFGGRLGDARGRHLAGAEPLEDDLPAIAIFGKRLRVEEDLNVHSAGGELRIVTAGADVLEEGVDGGVEGGVIGGRSERGR